MCTAISDVNLCHLFGRTLDLECSYGEATVIAPRAFPFNFLYEWSSVHHFAMIGTAHVRDGVPLFYDAVNERGLAAAALNFPQYAVYTHSVDGMHNVASFELIPWLLGRCDSVQNALELLKSTNIVSDSFRPDLPTTPLHWLISDRHCSVTVEPTSNGLRVIDNPYGVLTNSPEFDIHVTNTTNFMSLSPTQPQNTLCPDLPLSVYSRGMGAIGLPGDASSSSRFVRALFAKVHTARGKTSDEEISRFFHVMDTVSQPSGFALSEEGKPIRTVYTSCMDTESGAYYYTTYDCRRIQRVDMRDHNTAGAELIVFPREAGEDIRVVSKRT